MTISLHLCVDLVNIPNVELIYKEILDLVTDDDMDLKLNSWLVYVTLPKTPTFGSLLTHKANV